MTRKVKKAKEITDARISFVSLVGKAANKRQFLIVKDEEGKAAFTTYGKIIKTDSESHLSQALCTSLWSRTPTAIT